MTTVYFPAGDHIYRGTSFLMCSPVAQNISFTLLFLFLCLGIYYTTLLKHSALTGKEREIKQPSLKTLKLGCSMTTSP